MNKILSRSVLVQGLTVLFLVSISARSLPAQTYAWDPQQSTSATGSDPTLVVNTGTDVWNATADNWAIPGGGNDTFWPNTTGSIAEFGSANTPTGGSDVFTANVSGTLNAGGIIFNNYSGTSTLSNYIINGLGGATLVGPSGGTFTVSSPVAFFNNEKLQNIAFTGASTYQFTGTTVANRGNGVTLSGGDTFDNNVVFGTGSDFGEIGYAQSGSMTTGAGDTVTINKGWGTYFGNGNEVVSQKFILNGLGANTAGQSGTLGLGNNGNGYTGSATIGSDISVTATNNGATGTTTNFLIGSSTATTVSIPGITNPVSVGVGGIGGTGNVYLGYDGVGAGGVQHFVIAGNNNTYSGATIVFNSNGARNSGDTLAASGGVAAEAIQLNNSNVLPTSTTLVLGLNANSALTLGNGTVIAAANGAANGSPNWNAGGVNSSDGAFDLHGFNQTVAGLVTGTPTPGKNLIFNNGTGGASILTINGTTSLTTGFGGTIEDEDGTLLAAQKNAGGTTAVAVDGGSSAAFLDLTGANTYSGGTTAGNSAGTTSATATIEAGSNTAFGTGSVTSYHDGVVKIDSAVKLANNFSASGGSFQRSVAAGSKYDLGTTGTVTVGAGGTTTTAAILGSANASLATTLTYSGSATSAAINDGIRVSNVLTLANSAAPTDIYVLQLALPSVTSSDELGWLNGSNTWVNAIAGDTSLGGSAVADFNGSYASFIAANPTAANGSSAYLGSYGYDATNGTTWAILDDTGAFAIINTQAVPEPGTWALLLAGLGAMAWMGRRKLARQN